MPLSALGELLSSAVKKEVETQTFPLWLANYTVSKIKGVEPMEYQQFIENVNNAAFSGFSKEKKTRTAEEILEDFTPIIQADKGGIKHG